MENTFCEGFAEIFRGGGIKAMTRCRAGMEGFAHDENLSFAKAWCHANTRFCARKMRLLFPDVDLTNATKEVKDIVQHSNVTGEGLDNGVSNGVRRFLSCVSLCVLDHRETLQTRPSIFFLQ